MSEVNTTQVQTPQVKPTVVDQATTESKEPLADSLKTIESPLPPIDPPVPPVTPITIAATETTPKQEYGSYVKYNLRDVPDDLVVDKIKKKDEALNKFIFEFREYLEKHSHLPDIDGTMTMGQVKEIMERLPQQDQIRIMNFYTDIRFGDPLTKWDKIFSFCTKYGRIIVFLFFGLLLFFWIAVTTIAGDSVDGTDLAGLMKVVLGIFGGPDTSVTLP